MKAINKILLYSKNIQRSAVIWNAYAATMNSMQTLALLMVITRFGTMDDSGIFVIAYAVGNLMLNVGKFGVRQFQVTDVNEKYSLSAYVKSRKLSSALMIAFSVLYVGYNVLFNQYTAEKAAVILLICAVKLVEAYEDVYQGLMQQRGRLDVASKILGLRLTVFIVGCAALFMVTKNLVLTVSVNLAITLLLAVVLNKGALKALNFTLSNEKSGTVMELMLECLPLCACMCMNMYVANAPKYTIDTVVSSEVQTCFNIVFMPVFVIALLANFIFQPCLKQLGELWASDNIKGFLKRIAVLAVVVIGTCGAVTLVGAFIGAPILGFIYKVDLSEYNNILIIFMLSGGIVALQNLLIMAVTVVRYQKYMIFGYVLTSVLLFTTSKRVLLRTDLQTLTVYFMFAMLLLLLYCVVLLIAAVMKKRKGVPNVSDN